MPYVRQLPRPGDEQDRPSGRWAATYRDATGRRHTRTFLRERPARLWALGKEDEVRRGAHVDPSAGRQTVKAYAELWQKGRRVRQSTAAITRGRLDSHVLPRFGRMALADVTRTEVRAWIGELLEGGGKGGAPLASSTVAGILGTLSSMYAQAVDDQLLPANPCSRLSLPRASATERAFLDEHQLRRLVDAFPPEWRTWCLTVGYTGLRWGEVAALRVRRLDLLRRRLTVAETVTELPGGKVVFGPPKTRQSERTISLPAFVADALGEHLADRLLTPDSLVFPRPQGGPLRRSNFRLRIWLPSIERAGLTPAPRVHDLRHTHASLLIAEGVSMKAISDRLGHASIRITMDRYGHLLPDVDGTVVAALERRHEAAAVGQAVGQNVTNLGGLVTARDRS